jgi:hypothetical protein
MKELIKHILKEETEELDLRVWTFLTRRYEVNELNLGDNLKFKEIYFKVGDEYYGVSMWDDKKRQIRKILDMLQENNVIEPVNNYSNQNDPYRQKVIRTIKKFLYEVM